MLQALRCAKLKPTLTNKSDLKSLLERYDLKLKYGFGQNFLVNSHVVDKIINLANVCVDDEILEVGCGVGTLTCPLLEKGAKVASVEIDADLYPIVEETTSEYCGNFSLIKRDALKINAGDISFSPNKFVSNLPYEIAQTLIMDIFEKFAGVQEAVVMVQKEVADRIRATAGQKAYGAYTVKLNLIAQCVDWFFVGRNNFFPAPRVDSAVIKLIRNDEICNKEILNSAHRCADAAFFNRRKTILNSMSSYFGKDSADNIKALLDFCNIDQGIRGEKLSPQQYLLLGKHFAEFMR